VVAKEIEKVIGLAAGCAEMDVGDPDRAIPDRRIGGVAKVQKAVRVAKLAL
jgi:hypothetical protein